MFSESYESKMGLIRFSSNPIILSQPIPEIIQPLIKRQKEPFQFSDIYNNPICAFQPIFRYLLGVKNDDKNKQNASNNIQTKKPKKAYLNNLYNLIEREEKFESKKNKICKSFEIFKQTMVQNKKETFFLINLIQGKTKLPKQQNNQQTQQSFKQSLNKEIGQKIDRKLWQISQNYLKLKYQYSIQKSQLKYSLFSQKQQKNWFQFNNLSRKQSQELCFILINYLSKPYSESFFEQIETYSQNAQKIFKKIENREKQNIKLLKQLPYKQSSFYWQKISQCCRQISKISHYTDLDHQKIQNFEAEYIGIVTYDTLSKLKDNQWLDNTITSSIIEYLKHIQGANNYHNNHHFKNFIFNHSETSSFLNAQRNYGENYSKYEKLIFLVNIQNSHWFVIVAYNKFKEIIVYDSMKQTKLSEQHCTKISHKLQQSNNHESYQIKYRMSPYQTNTSDCGVFSIINMILAVDKDQKSEKRNQFPIEIVSEIRQSLFLFLLYLGYCKKFNFIVRKDYFDILFRSTIQYNIPSFLHESKKQKRK